MSAYSTMIKTAVKVTAAAKPEKSERTADSPPTISTATHGLLNRSLILVSALLMPPGHARSRPVL